MNRYSILVVIALIASCLSNAFAAPKDEPPVDFQGYNYLGALFGVEGAHIDSSSVSIPYGLLAGRRLSQNIGLALFVLDTKLSDSRYWPRGHDYTLGVEVNYYFGGIEKRFHAGLQTGEVLIQGGHNDQFLGLTFGYDLPISERLQFGVEIVDQFGPWGSRPGQFISQIKFFP